MRRMDQYSESVSKDRGRSSSPTGELLRPSTTVQEGGGGGGGGGVRMKGVKSRSSCGRGLVGCCDSKS